MDEISVSDLPPGYRFKPTDEEIVSCYLKPKIIDSAFSSVAIAEANFNKIEPWDLHKEANMGETEWYFFFQRDKKYPTGTRTNRATVAGYWKATGKDKEVFSGKSKKCLIGMKKTLVFYKGRAPKGEKTNWVMHEYRLEGKYSYYNLPKTAKDEWVVSRVFHKTTGLKMNPMNELLRINSTDEMANYLAPPALPPLMDPSYSEKAGPSYSAPQNELMSQQYPISNTFLYQTPLNNNIPNPQIYHNPSSSYQVAPNYYNQLQFSGYQGYNIHDHSISSGTEAYNTIKECKVEQFSSNQPMVSQSMVTQDTGISTDMNNNTHEISSNPVFNQDITTNIPYDDGFANFDKDLWYFSDDHQDC